MELVTLPELWAEEVRQARAKLLRWFKRHGRKLPWRATHDPYQIWVSEIMLQQTTTAVVERYFTRFIARFPTLRHLAEADEAEVFKFWEGLGYYRRASHLLRTAQIVKTEYAGHFPENLEELIKLPGIGRYTAGAIVSLAFNKPAPILEANTRRVFRRWLGAQENGREHGEKALWQVAEAFATCRRPREVNLALMDVGSLVCLPRDARCPECPLRTTCESYRNGGPQTFSSGRTNSSVPRHELALVCHCDGRFLVMRRKQGRWQGLWDFPRVLISEGVSRPTTPDTQAIVPVIKRVIEFADVRPQDLSILLRLRHQVTRYRITLDVILVPCPVSVELRDPEADQTRWVSAEVLNELAVPAPTRRIVEALLAHPSFS